MQVKRQEVREAGRWNWTRGQTARAEAVSCGERPRRNKQAWEQNRKHAQIPSSENVHLSHGKTKKLDFGLEHAVCSA